MPIPKGDLEESWARARAASEELRRQRDATRRNIYLRDSDSARGSITQAESRLLGWLVAGNVAGMYFVIDRQMKGELPETIIFASLYGAFLAGAVLAVLGLFYGLVINSLIRAALDHQMVLDYSVPNGEPGDPDEWEASNEWTKLIGRLDHLRRARLGVYAFLVLSALALGLGIASPLWLMFAERGA